jgi:isoleucyl-tRNA synthetase
MPFAQFHYPFENIEKFEANFPGDFIAEYVGQVRAWFYCLHAVSTGLFNKNAFNNVIVTGTIAGNDGRKMSKSYGNFTDPNELMDKYSADALRFLLLSSPLLNGEDFTLQDKEVSDISRKLNMIWNMYNFFTLYADVDGWEWDGSMADPTPNLVNPLDLWIVTRVHQLNKKIDERMQAYDISNATKPIIEFLDDASNWYVRRSRKRFWKSQNDPDKEQAYRSLHYVLVQLSMVMAPFTPFIAEELYQKLTGGESVHLLDWPEVGHINELAISTMSDIRLGIEQGLSQRAAAKIKVRQPLSEATVYITHSLPEHESDQYKQIISEELNVKKVHLEQIEESQLSQAGYQTKVDLEITPKLKKEGVMRELVRAIQNARKQANLEVDDRIELKVSSDSAAVNEALKTFAETIKQETLAINLNQSEPKGFETTIKVDDEDVIIELARISH